MDSSFKQMWVRALRSGKYEQATGALRREVGFCCLGVLCDVFDTDKWNVGIDDDDGDERWSYGYEDDNFIFKANEVLPMHVARIAGLDTQNPEVPYGIEGEMKSLASINDNGATFAEIADLIETHL